MTIFLRCPECSTTIEAHQATKAPDGTRLRMCAGCGLRFGVTEDDVKAAETSGGGTVEGQATGHQRRDKVAKAAPAKSEPKSKPKPAPQATPEPKAEQSTPPPVSAKEPEPEPSTPPEPSPANDAVLNDAKKRAAAAGQAPYEPETDNPVLADAMRRARQ